MKAPSSDASRFPESWYSWRHQFSALAEAGYHAVAPDMRGYGDSDKPFEIEAYNQVEVVNDIIGLIPALGYETAVVFGHDWGAPTAWSCALNHPDKVSAVGALSVPFRPRGDSPPLATLKAIFKDRFLPAVLPRTRQSRSRTRKDPALTIRKFYHMASGEMNTSCSARNRLTQTSSRPSRSRHRNGTLDF